jgi:cell division protein FtsB
MTTGVTRLKGEAKKKGKSKENLIFAFSLILIIVVFAVPMYFGAERKFALEREIADIKAQTAEATEYGDKLKNQIKYSDEDEYVEKIARERLNMVKPDEVVYIDKNK